MKKFLFSIVAIAFAVTANAETVFSFAPISAAAGASGSTVRFDVKVFRDAYSGKNMNGAQYDIYVPDFMTITNCTTTKGILPSYTEYDDDLEMDVTKYYHSGTCEELKCTISGYKCFRMTMTTTTYGVYFAETAGGVIARHKYTISDDAAEGVYPIYIKNVELAGYDGTANMCSDATTFITIGNPATKTFNLSDCISSVVTPAIPADATVDISNATEVYGTCSNSVNGTYARTVSGKYASVYLPFDATVEGATAYEYKSKDDENAYFTKVTSATLSKNTAYLLKKNDGAESFTATGTSTLDTKATTGEGFIGTCEPIKITNEDGYGLSEDKFHKIAPYESETSGTTIPAFRAYLNTGTTGSAKSSLNIVIDDEATGITTADLMEADGEPVFGINGVRVNAKSAHNGIYIKKGKKVAVK